MKKTELVKGISSSVLGFGCAPILGSVDAKTALRALDCAIDCGINHFDLARSYGYGDAEGFIGKVIKNRRDDMVIASKFGIKANWKAAILKPVKPLLRGLINNIKKQNASKPQPVVSNNIVVADRFHNRIPLNGNEMRKSLEKSLRELNTDYLDYFFIHEPLETIHEIEDLLTTADKLKAEGKIRALGLAYMRSQEHLHTAYINKFDLLQFDNSPGAPGYEDTLIKRGDKPNILFSPLRGGTTSMKPDEKLKKLFDDFQNSVILCSMFNEKHIKANAALLS
ncbi:Aldo/keto reductase family protein [Mucilaginibacter pineti]|uniref:Aldo/keto reductase family protein n=1 Tax=Mucilaginibacter pineti TaxID=1391627 RepID=A0A1G6W9P6_9SPHI|nr:aldo/keto reductase [Mucilaginibacter pineti]SDD62551.1 Aldo/keto reductase family protein [Mucilaginibacter pineti]